MPKTPPADRGEDRRDNRGRHRGDICVGLISGTSMDGIDAAAVEFGESGVRVLAAETFPFEGELRRALDRLREDPETLPAAGLARLDARLGEALGAAAKNIVVRAGLDPEAVLAVGSHGQTVLHRPDADPPHSLQIGDPARIARATGLVTVADFRRADLAAGGQGAPLAPLLHAALLGDCREHRAVLNLGGIANLTLLPADGPVSGFDTGPANCLLDAWYRRHHPGAFDRGGRWAESGRVDQDWLEELLAEPYFARPPPRSTGIEHFGSRWLDNRLPGWAEARPADVQATLAELTAATVADPLQRPAGFTPVRLIVCGGGVHNRDLVRRIARRLPGVEVESSAVHGLDPDFVEAVLFAWLARERLAGRRMETPPITGAREAVVLGAVHRPPR